MKVAARVLELRFPADPTQLRRVREEVQRAGARIDLSAKVISDLVIAVNVACMNIIEHAYKGDHSGEIVLEINNNESDLEVVLTDFAEPVDIAGIQSRNLEELRPGGLGTHFIGAVFDAVTYDTNQEQGTILTLEKKKQQVNL